MNYKKLNLLGVVVVFIGLFLLMSLHISHTLTGNVVDSDQYSHILVGFPVSILGAMLLILAERKQLNK